MTSFEDTILSRHLSPCPYCKNEHPVLHSGPCSKTGPHLFEAQIHCPNCGAKSPLISGKEDLTEARVEATRKWMHVKSEEPSFRKILSDANRWVFTLSIGASIGNILLADGAYSKQILGVMVGTLAFGLILGLIEGRAIYVRQSSQWKKVKARLEGK